MGVDAAIFAIKAKKHIQIDRYYNLSYCYPDTFRDWHQGIKASGVLDILFSTIVEALSEKDRESCRFENGDYTGWWRKIIDFLLMYPDDLFFIRTDHDDPDSFSFMKQRFNSAEADPVLKEHYNTYEEVLEDK